MLMSDYSKHKKCPLCKKLITNKSAYCSKHVPRTQIWREKIANSHKGIMNPQWKDKVVGYKGLHQRIRRYKPKPEWCESCNKQPPHDLANISQKYLTDISDWEWLCRHCHMVKDGRINNLKQYKVTS